MKTLLDILRDSLPNGAELQNEKETTNRFKYDFYYMGKSVKGEICKAVAPGFEESYVCRAVATCMSQIYIGAGDMEHGAYWLKIAQVGRMDP